MARDACGSPWSEWVVRAGRDVVHVAVLQICGIGFVARHH